MEKPLYQTISRVQFSLIVPFCFIIDFRNFHNESIKFLLVLHPPNLKGSLVWLCQISFFGFTQTCGPNLVSNQFWFYDKFLPFHPSPVFVFDQQGHLHQYSATRDLKSLVSLLGSTCLPILTPNYCLISYNDTDI